MKKVRHGKLFAIVMLLFVLTGGLGNPEIVQAKESSETAESSENAESNETNEDSGTAAGTGEKQNGNTKNNNTTKKVTKKNGDVTIETSFGIDGFAAYDSPVLVTITVAYNKDFTGSIRMIPSMTENQTVVAYGEDISLAKGEAKTFSFTPSALGGSGKIKIELLDENEKVIYAEEDTVSLNNIGTNAMMGILSDDYSGLNYFDGVPVSLSGYQGVISTLELTTASFPDNKEALSILNYILIDNYDTANLSDEQYNALKGWVNDGGVLILSLGANYQNVLHKFSDEFLTGTLGSMNKKQLTWEAFGTGLALDNVDCVEFVLDGGEEMESFATDKTAYKKELGMGAVVVLSYDLGMEPIAGYENKKVIAAALINEAAVAEVVNRLNGNSTSAGMYNGTDIAKMMNDARKPSALLYSLILILYVVLAGPVLYIGLKKVNKREKIWIAIPVVSLVFTGIIYGTGFLYRVSKPIIDTFSVISFDGNGTEEKVYMNITCPKAKQYRFQLNDEYKNVQYNLDYSYSIFDAGEDSEVFDFMLKRQNDGIELITNNASAFKDTKFTVSRTGENNVGALDTDLHFYTDGFDGTITNNTNYDLENVVINFENHYYQIDNLKKGETASIDKSKLIEAYAYGTFDRLYGANSSLYTDRDVYKNYQIDTFMENAYVDTSAYNQGCIWAGIGSYRPDVVDAQSGKTYGKAVIFTTFTGSYEDVEGAYYPDISKMAVASDGDYDQTDGMIYSNNITVTYSFEDCQSITELINRSYGKMPADYTSGIYANVYAYNVLNGNYEQIFINSDTISGEELQKYLSENVLILRYETDSAMENTTAFMPKITAKGE